ncbi:MAG: glucosaminidase domain-containing protein [Bacilli bacterium]|nr:glucosaminidase domain-containing protein [Bacilli bacterium]
MKSNRKTVFIALTTVFFCVSVGVFSGSFVIKTSKKLNDNNKIEHISTISTPRIEYIADLYQINNNKTTVKEEIPETVEEVKTEEKQEEVPKKEESKTEKPKITEEKKEETTKEEVIIETPKEEPVKQIVYDNMTLEELSVKINKSLNSTVALKGELFASYSLQVGVDPYIAVAIMLHETGCKWNCSTLVQQCNNVGGQKGTPRCGSGSYKKFDTLDDGIRGFLDNLNKNYFSQGLNTPETIARKYTGHAGTEWTIKVNNYIEEIKNK